MRFPHLLLRFDSKHTYLATTIRHNTDLWQHASVTTLIWGQHAAVTTQIWGNTRPSQHRFGATRVRHIGHLQADKPRHGGVQFMINPITHGRQKLSRPERRSGAKGRSALQRASQAEPAPHYCRQATAVGRRVNILAYIRQSVHTYIHRYTHTSIYT